MFPGSFRRSCLRYGVCVAAFLPAPAFADASQSDEQEAATQHPSQLGEIVVTAQRREESLQDVPVAVTALGSADIEAKQVLSVMSLNKAVPGFFAAPTLTPIELTTSIRGVSQQPSVSQDPAIGLYVDGVYNIINAGSNLGMIDMERVEVLKGPQGTLFGRNTIGGAISITTAKPTDRFEGYVQARVGNYGAQTYTGVLNVPLSPGAIDARLVYQHDELDGYGRNFTMGGRNNRNNQEYVRGTIKITPDADWDIIAQGFYTDANGTPSGTRLGYIDETASLIPDVLPPTSILIPLLSGNPDDTLANYVGRGGYYDTFSGVGGYWFRQYGGNVTVTGQLSDSVTVKSITAYSKTNYNNASDLDGTPYEVVDLIAFPVSAKQFSEEFQVFGNALDNRLEWIAGLYYFQVNGNQTSRVVVLGPFNDVPMHSASLAAARNKSTSAFAQLTYEIVPRVRLTAGLRYVVDERKVAYRDSNRLGSVAQDGVHGEVEPGTFVSCNLANAPQATDPADCIYRRSVKYKFAPWTVGLDFKPNDQTLIYAKVSKGFRSGAFNQSGPQASPDNPEATAAALALFEPVAPERLISYEGGAKLDLLDRRLRINAALYWSKYDNLQVSVNRTVPDCPSCAVIATLENSGTAHIWGGELEVTALLGDLTLSGQLGYTRPKYVSGPGVGTPVPNVPKVNYAISANYPIETGFGTLTLNGSYSHQSSALLWPIAPDTPQVVVDSLSQRGYGLIDARVTFELRDMPLTLAVYGRNLADKKYYNVASESPLGYTVNFPGVPRMYGVEATFRF